MSICKLSKPVVKNAESPQVGTSDHRRGYRVIWDSETPGFGLIVTNKGIKSYIVRARIKGKERRHTLGRSAVLGPDVARDLARAWLGKIAEGRDPVEEKRLDAVSGITLRQAMETYCASGRPRESTQELVRARFTSRLVVWLDLPLIRINEDMVERRFLDIGEETPADANITFRYFRVVWNFAKIRTEDSTGKAMLPDCPTRRLTKGKLWKPDIRRKRAVLPHQLPAFIQAVDALPDEKARLFFKFILHTGCRASEAAGLLRKDIDHRAGAVHFIGTKSRSNPEFSFPASRQLLEVIRQAEEVGIGDYLFGDLAGNERDNPFAHEVTLLSKAYGKFGPHDLRRTYISMGNLASVPEIALKKLVNHSQKANVTAGYDAADLAMLKPHAQRISDLIESHLHSADVISIKRAG